MKLVIVTGMSGAGKSTALKMLEDMGYFCADNLPLPLADKFVEYYCSRNDQDSIRTETSGLDQAVPGGQVREVTSDGEGKFSLKRDQVALGIDVRSFSSREEIEGFLRALEGIPAHRQIFYMESSDETLLKRYKETRRAHPLAGEGHIRDGIQREREILLPMKERADYIIDTSLLLVRDLKQEIARIFVDEAEYRDLFITVLSFGFKYGIPQDSDLVFDVRFAPNPYYIEELRGKTGLDPEIASYLRQFSEVREFEDKLTDMVRFLIPHYIKEGKNQLVISLGCTGGRHRSVMMAQSLYERLLSGHGYGIRVEHRDLNEDPRRKG